MKFSTKTRYGLRTMLEIASNKSGRGVLQKDISARQNISNKYLDTIIHSLKVAGLISNAQGKKSGYVLMKDPSSISIYDIHRAFEPDICIVECLRSNSKCTHEKKCRSRNFWEGLNSVVKYYMSANSLSDLLQSKKNDLLYPDTYSVQY